MTFVPWRVENALEEMMYTSSNTEILDLRAMRTGKLVASDDVCILKGENPWLSCNRCKKISYKRSFIHFKCENYGLPSIEVGNLVTSDDAYFLKYGKFTTFVPCCARKLVITDDVYFFKYRNS